jgi:translocation and assembly module TamA
MKSILILLTPILLSAIPYEINFVGLKDEKVLKAMFDASDLVTLQDRPPASINAIHYRVANDIPDLLKVLRAYGYYDATISSDVELDKDETVQVYLRIQPGPQYKLSSYDVFYGSCNVKAEIPCCPPFTPKSLGLLLDSPALSFDLVNAELTLLDNLSRCGYPLASVEKRRVIVDMQEKNVEASVCIDEGPLSKFGPLSVLGLKTIKPRFVLRRIGWKEGDRYDSLDMEETQKRLLNTDLFSSVMISHGNELDARGELPMRMQLSEAKHRQVSIGVFYATVDGPGVNFLWTHRNIRGMGETLSLNAEVSGRYNAGTAIYKKPDFLTQDQSLKLLAQVERQHIHAFIALALRGSSIIDRKIDEQKNFSVGLTLENIDVTNSANNGDYLLLTVPMLIKYNTADDQLNPTKGFTITYQPQPFQLLKNGCHGFLKQRLTGTFYIPLGTSRFVFAGRVQFGSILGTKQKNIPLPVLFLGGSEDDLRGYRYLTVSPVNKHRKPYGGRSAVFLTAETRIRFTQSLGIVPFADFGTVTFNEMPQFDAKWFKSAGVGLRYYTVFGPLRADIGFPLDRRKGIDPPFRIYASIGQTF